jgi:hypothetical protein
MLNIYNDKTTTDLPTTYLVRMEGHYVTVKYYIYLTIITKKNFFMYSKLTKQKYFLSKKLNEKTEY